MAFLHWFTRAESSALKHLFQGLLHFGKLWCLYRALGGCWPGQPNGDHWEIGKCQASSAASAPGSSEQRSGNFP